VRGEEFEREPEVVSREDALADLDRAEYIFEQAYAGIDGIAPTPPREALELARSRIATHAAVPPRAFAGLLRQLFWQPDGHLSFSYGGSAPIQLLAKPYEAARVSDPVFDRMDASGDVWAAERRLIHCGTPAGEPTWATARQAILPTPEGRFVLGLFGDAGQGDVPCSLDDGGGAELLVHLTMRSAAPSAPSSIDRAVSLEPGDVPVLAVRTFDNAAVARLKELPAIARRLRTSKGFVVDVRGNGGGNYAFAEAFLLELTNATLRKLDEREVVSVAAAEGRANTVRRHLTAGLVPKSAEAHFRAELEALDAEARDLRAAGTPRTEVTSVHETVRGHADGALEARAVFLIDGGCASACEMMIAMARQIPGVVVVGQNTRGSMAVGELGMFLLRHSGVAITFGTRAFRDPLGDFDERRGFLPDFWIEDQDALSVAKRIAREPSATLAMSSRDAFASGRGGGPVKHVLVR
jgi:hypothetical protein